MKKMLCLAMAMLTAGFLFARGAQEAEGTGPITVKVWFHSGKG
jgi:hypothetical protein